MKRNFHYGTYCFLCIAMLLFVSFTAYGHSGRTDSKGGHYDRSTGEYHYHHGLPPHDHPGGVCPYASKTSRPTNQLQKKQTPVPTVKPKTYLVFTETPSPEPVKQTETAEPEHKTDWILDPIDYFGSNIIPVVVLLSFIITILIKKP